MATSNAVHTIADIARLAGVSKATVSRALNDSPLVSTETKERIRAIAREHSFQMNASARRLNLKQSNTIALVNPYIKPDGTVAEAFMLEIMGGISAGLHASDYDLLVIQVDDNDREWARKYLDTGRVDGFITMDWTYAQERIKTLRDAKAAFIMWSAPPGRYDFCTISGDSFSGGRLATEHLLGTGRTRIAFLGGPDNEPEVQDRSRGYETALRDAGQLVDPALVVHGDWDQPDTAGPKLTRELLERTPDLDAVFANSDPLAIAAMETLREHGRRIPDDVAVIGYDDIAAARHSNPPLTTIKQDGPLIGRLLAQNLIQHLQTGVVTNVSIPAELVVRKSA
jgi:DNA-binding LacI/PurR family transcriptional regulator